jgi:hypothetical protein
LQGRPGYKVSGLSFKFALFLKRNFSAWMWTFYRDARNVCIRAGTIPASAMVWVGFAYDLLAYGIVNCWCEEHVSLPLDWPRNSVMLLDGLPVLVWVWQG